jgi:hypothetical protein
MKVGHSGKASFYHSRIAAPLDAFAHLRQAIAKDRVAG